ncbi:MAG TPA: MarR family transcriptional regulator [Candidatus Saccharimonadales bacterium]|nr:MarR family transcriptional regulator [Candidatus Saccharimonadales bacterium]
MSTTNRAKLLEEAINQGKRTGNLNVLLTNALAQRIGLSATEYECYSLLLDNGPLPAGKLAKQCGITTGGLTGLVDRLQNAGLVERTADPTDRRKVLIKAKHNKKLYQKLWSFYAPIAQGFRSINNQYTDEQLTLLVQHYQKINDLMEEGIGRLGADR